MSGTTKIEWTDRTWTPVVGCDPVSPACAFCYAALMAARLEAMGHADWSRDFADCPDCGNGLSDYNACPECDGHDGDGMSFGPNSLPRLDWVIAGGESGPRARPMNPDWARGLRDQCAIAGVPFMFKQWGEWVPREAPCVGDRKVPSELIGGSLICRVGKKAAGRLLDGVEHNGGPK